MWSGWVALTIENVSKIPSGAGIYKIRCVKNGKTVSIKRCKGVDKRGILLIGRSVDIKRRLRDFYNSITKPKNSNWFPHIEGFRFCALDYKNNFPIENLQFSYKKVGEREIRKEENNELIRYQYKYLEIPPLNNSGGC